MIENVSPKKFLGQHFLIDENISKKIVNSFSLKEFDKIVEIGPGKGALTKYLFEFSDRLILIEYDAESVEFIKSSFKNLKKSEEKFGFSEAPISDLNETKKFFNLGPKNDWKDLLPNQIRLEIEKKFQKEMMELGYLKS